MENKKIINEINNVNSISSYLAMFPVNVPYELINKYSKENDTIMDNFSGRGTTAITARFLNRNFVGNDLNPYSFVLTKFKISKINKLELLNKINKLELEYKNWNKKINWKNYEEMLIFYSKENLRQILFLREKIGKNWLSNNDYDNAILAISLGLMHGPKRKDGSTIYFSVSMSNFISMSPNYVKQYIIKNNLMLPKDNIFEKIKDRVNKKISTIFEKKYNANFKYADSLNELNFIKNNSISLVITSPPYLSLVDYTVSNWIKLWLLGFEKKNLKNQIKLKDKLLFQEYILFIESYLNNIYPKLKNKGKVCLVIGDVYNLPLIEEVWNKIKSNIKFRKVDLIIQNINDNKKSLRSMNSKAGKATKIEKILILEKE